MNESNTNKFDFTLGKIGSILPLGYLYLILLGIASDSIYYGLLDVNIMSYSTVLDVLLSPVAHLTDSLVFSALILLLPVFLYFYILLSRYFISRRKSAASKKSLIETTPLLNLWLIITTFTILSAYIGFGLGGGYTKQQSLKSGTLKPTHEITFSDNESVQVNLIGNNSGFVFYVADGNTSVSITPISSHVKAIRKITK